MDLLDRYLHAIRRNLPATKADDIVAELRDDLLDRVETREDKLGHPLDCDETASLLKEFGHPLVVASRYRQQQVLIGPDSFPFYRFTLRLTLLIVAALAIVTAATRLLFDDQTAMQALGTGISSLWLLVLVVFAIVTIVFAVLDRTGFAADHIKHWNPTQLPDVKDRRSGPWESAIEVAMSIVFLLWWSDLVRLPFATGNAMFHIEGAPIWAALYWPIFAVAAIRLVHNLIQWLRPRWTLVRAVIGGITAIGGLAIAVILYRAGHWAVVVSTGMGPQEALQLQNSLDLSLRIAIVAVTIIWILQCLGFWWRIARLRLAPLASL